MTFFSKAKRQAIHAKMGGRCGYCGSVILIKEMQIDHMHPLSRRYTKGLFGEYVVNDINNENNLMPSCRTCNHYKRALTIEEFRTLMTTLHERVEAIYIVRVAMRHGMMKLKPFAGKFYFETQTKFA